MSHILEHDKKNIHVWKVSEKGHQCIKAASLYETFKIQHPSFNILIIIITFTSIAPFSLLSNSDLQQQLLKKKLIKWTNNSALYKNFKIKLSYALKFTINYC